MNSSLQPQPGRTRRAPFRALSSRTWLALAALAVAGAGGATLTLAGGPSAGAAAGTVTAANGASPGILSGTALTVEVTSPQPMTMARTLAASGSIAARDELLVGSDAQGVRLVQVLVDVGSSVRQGQLLALGDDAQLQAQSAQQEAAIRQARVELAQAEANFERADRIRDSGVYSTEALQTRRTAAEAAAAKLDLAQAQKRELEVRIAQTRVRAPADGVIARRSATVGAVMQPGMELFRLLRGGEIEWRAEVPDHALESIKPGAAARIRLDEHRLVEGRVRLVAPTVDARTRNGLVHVTLPNNMTGTPLRAGGHAQGELQIGSAQVWTLPEVALLSRDGQPFVYVIGDNGTARATRLSTGARHGGRVEVRGLPPEARVVTTGAGFVKDGERVRVAVPATAAAPAAPAPSAMSAAPTSTSSGAPAGAESAGLATAQGERS